MSEAAWNDGLAGIGPERAERPPRQAALPFIGALRDAWTRHKVSQAARALKRTRRMPDLVARDIVAVIVVRDAARRLPDIFRHHRDLGVDRFVLVDNGSRDDTRAIALGEPDVEVYVVEDGGPDRDDVVWAMAAIRLTGLGRWYLVISADELFVYDGCEEHDLHALAERLERWRIPAMPALAVDMYGEGPVRSTYVERGGRLLEACPLFDGDYTMDRKASRRWLVYRGGPFERLSGGTAQPVLARTPFMRWTGRTLYRSPQEATPVWCNVGAMRGCLLRFRFMEDIADRAFAAVVRDEREGGAPEERLLLDLIEADPGLTLAHERSIRYESSHDLVAAGLMPSIGWRR